LHHVHHDVNIASLVIMKPVASDVGLRAFVPARRGVGWRGDSFLVIWFFGYLVIFGYFAKRPSDASPEAELPPFDAGTRDA
jgi:hypothetical protein